MSKKSSKGAPAQKCKTVRVNLSVGEEEYQLLGIRALTSGSTAGELVTKLIAAKAKEWGFPANLMTRAGVYDRQMTGGHMNSPDASDAQPSAN